MSVPVSNLLLFIWLVKNPDMSYVGYVCRVHGDRKGSSGAATLFPESSVVIERPRGERAKRLSRGRLAQGCRFYQRMSGRMGDCKREVEKYVYVYVVCVCVWECVWERERKQMKIRQSKRRTGARNWKKKYVYILDFARRRFFCSRVSRVSSSERKSSTNLWE